MLRQFATKLADGTYPEGAFCSLVHKEYNQGDSEMVMIDEYHGCVLSEYERNMYDDSDFIAVIWDFNLNKPRRITYATTRAWTYPCGCVVDATEEVKQLYAEWKAKAKTKWDEYKKAMDFYIPKKGRMAKSITIRGKAKDLEGEIFWIGNSKYSGEKTIGIKDEKGRVGYVALDRSRIWHPEKAEWVVPASFSNGFQDWVVSETEIPSPKEFSF